MKYGSVVGATGYDIQIDGTIIDNGTLVSFTKAGFPGTQHTISVRSKNSGGTSDWSTESTALIPQETPGVPKGITINSDINSVTILWNPIDGVTSNDIEADGIIIPVGKNIQYKDMGLLPGTLHKYRVRANNEGGNGLWSSIVTKNTTLAIPQNLVANTSNGAIQLLWQQVVGATSYELEIDGTTNKISGTTFTQSDALPNQKHIYRVRALNTITTSEWGASINAQLPMQVFSGKFGAGVEFEFEVGANNVKAINSAKFTIIYDPSQVDLVDLCSNTQNIDLSMGNIEKSNIKILQLVPGKIVLMVNDDEITGEYSGIVDTIVFKSKTSEQVSISYSIN